MDQNEISGHFLGQQFRKEALHFKELFYLQLFYLLLYLIIYLLLFNATSSDGSVQNQTMLSWGGCRGQQMGG